MRNFISMVVAAAAVAVGCASGAPGNEPRTSPSSPDSATAPSAPGSPRVSADGTCGGLAGLACAAGQFCSFPPEATCGAADQTGRCTPVPEMCTEQFAPVCGCNDKTYPNACYAAREGISVGRTGACVAATDAGTP